MLICLFFHISNINGTLFTKIKKVYKAPLSKVAAKTSNKIKKKNYHESKAVYISEAGLYYKDGKVCWYVTPADPPNISNIKLSKGLKELLNLPDQKYLGITTGQPINESSINFTFNNAAMVFLTCDQIDDTYVNNQSSKTIAVMPIASAINGALTLTSPTSAVFIENYDKKLNFRLQDKNGNELPVKQMLVHLTINDD